jgi:hypothetical protein
VRCEANRQDAHDAQSDPGHAMTFATFRDQPEGEHQETEKTNNTGWNIHRAAPADGMMKFSASSIPCWYFGCPEVILRANDDYWITLGTF